MNELLSEPRSVAAGRMRLVQGARNPSGALDALYLLVGDATAGPIEAIEIDPAINPAIHLYPRKGVRHLRIFHFNDLHNALQAHGQVQGRAQGPDSQPAPLFSRIVHRYRAARTGAGADEVVLLLCGGDDHTGTPFDELIGWTPDEFVLDPAYVAYSAAGVEVATLGNHDLDRGSAMLAIGIERNAAFPVLSANLGGSRALLSGRHYYPGALCIAKGLRIGLLGLTTPVDTRTGTASDPGLVVASPLATLRNVLPALADIADIVIVMSHCGYGVDSHSMPPAFGSSYLAEGDVALARLAAQLTARPVTILGAHSHTVLNLEGFGPETLIDGVPILQAGGHGSHVGEFEATLQLDSTRAQWSINARLHRLAGSPRGGSGAAPDSDAQTNADMAFESTVIGPMRLLVRQRANEVLATVDAGTDLSREATLRQRYCGECALINFVCDALAARSAQFPHGPAVLAIVNSTAIADGLPADGPLTFNDWYRVQPFADTLQLCDISATELAAILHSNAQRVVRPEECDGPGAIDLSGYVSRGFLQFSGALRYRLHLGGSAREATVSDITLAGLPLFANPARTIRVVLTNYLGAGGYAESWNGNPIGAGVQGFLPGYDLRPIPKHDTGLVFRNEVIAYLRGLGRISSAHGAVLDGRLVVI
ncbi:MAG: 5'-nucleotidase C-terminal domain-containing protein [Betaproteobacteria bacterium]